MLQRQGHMGAAGGGRWQGGRKEAQGAGFVVVMHCCAEGCALRKLAVNSLKSAIHDSRGTDSRLKFKLRPVIPCKQGTLLCWQTTLHLAMFACKGVRSNHTFCMLREGPCSPYLLSAPVGCCPADARRHCCPAPEAWQHQRGPWQPGPGLRGRQHQRTRSGAGPLLLV